MCSSSLGELVVVVLVLAIIVAVGGLERARRRRRVADDPRIRAVIQPDDDPHRSGDR